MRKLYLCIALLVTVGSYGQVATLTETFDVVTSNTATPVPGWTATNNSNPVGTTGWFQGNPTAFAGFSNGYIGANYQNTGSIGDISNWLISPVLELVNGRQIKFWSRAGGQTYPDRLEVRLSTAGSSVNVGTTSTSVGDFTTVLLEINPTLAPNTYPETWTLYTLTLSGISGTVSGRVAFRYNVTGGGSSGSNSNYIGIDEFTYNVAAVTPPPCVTLISPANGATNVNPYPSITFKWNTTPTATAYDFYIGTTNPPTTNIGSVSADSINIINAAYNTTYYWYVAPKNSGGAATGCAVNTRSFTTSAPPPPPSNDSCGTPIQLTLAPQSGTTLGATQSYYGNICSGGNPTADDDVWYKFTAISTGTAVITVQGGTGFDAVVEAFSGACGSLTSVACIDTSANAGREQLTVNAVNGTEYRIRVFSWSGGTAARGTFQISADGAAFPVTLTAFTGHTEGNINTLSWTTSTELNNDRFELQRSADGKNYSSIASIGSKAENGNSNSTLHYTFNDLKPLMGSSYYRLKQVDRDGKYSYSSVVELKQKAAGVRISSVYPNPAQSELAVLITSSAAEKATIVVTDLTGKVLMQQTIQLANGSTRHSVNVQSLSTGTYLVKLVAANGETNIQRFVRN